MFPLPQSGQQKPKQALISLYLHPRLNPDLRQVLPSSVYPLHILLNTHIYHRCVIIATKTHALRCCNETSDHCNLDSYSSNSVTNITQVT